MFVHIILLYCGDIWLVDISYLLLFTMVTVAFIIVHIYFKHVMRIIDRRWVRILNYVALYAGFTSAYGLIMVGSFQVTDIIMFEH